MVDETIGPNLDPEDAPLDFTGVPRGGRLDFVLDGEDPEEYLGGLPERQRRAIELKYGIHTNSRTYEEIALEENLTRETIRQDHNQGLRGLARAIRAKRRTES